MSGIYVFDNDEQYRGAKRTIATWEAPTLVNKSAVYESLEEMNKVVNDVGDNEVARLHDFLDTAGFTPSTLTRGRGARRTVATWMTPTLESWNAVYESRVEMNKFTDEMRNAAQQQRGAARTGGSDKRKAPPAGVGSSTGKGGGSGGGGDTRGGRSQQRTRHFFHSKGGTPQLEGVRANPPFVSRTDTKMSLISVWHRPQFGPFFVRVIVDIKH